MKTRKPRHSTYKTGRPTRPTYAGRVHKDFMEEGLKSPDISGVIVNRARGAGKKTTRNSLISNEGSEGQEGDSHNGVENGTMLSEQEGIEKEPSHERISVRVKGASKTAKRINPDQGITAVEEKMKAAAEYNRLKAQRLIWV